jgi:Zn-dependent protease with chaperone function
MHLNNRLAHRDRPRAMGRWRWLFRTAGFVSWTVWFAIITAAEHTSSQEWSFLSPAAWLLAPPALVMALCDGWEVVTLARLQGLAWRPGTWLGRLVYRNLLPCSFVVLAIWEAGAERVPLGLLWYAAAYLSYILLARLSRMLDLLFLTGQRLRSGELHDRIVAVAAEQGVPLDRLTVAATESRRLANAAAMLGNDVLLTDYLVQQLTTREVVALVAHELAHLRMRPLIVRCVALVTACAVVAVIMNWVDIVMGGAVALPHQVALALLAIYFLLRRFEYAADAAAARWTGDPEALAAAIVKVAVLNLAPLHWSALEELVHSRPSVLRRVRAIAARQSWAPAKLRTTLAAAHSCTAI